MKARLMNLFFGTIIVLFGVTIASGSDRGQVEIINNTPEGIFLERCYKC